MRPVRLVLNGFAQFREHTVIDFTDADYFAITGPTGAGKSTILDALTFALYGSAPRWGATNAIRYALAPSSNRGTVALTFDVGAHRYQVAREVRRSGEQVQQKNVSLVRFTDPTVVEPDPSGAPPEVLAGEIRELNALVEELLGLSFDHFCQCVVLPQGEFARFLTANPMERQKILLKLLGAGAYDQVGKRAGAQAAQAKTQVELLTDQLGHLADATPDAVDAAQATVTALEALVGRVDDVVPQITDALTRAENASRTECTARAAVTALKAVRTPEGIGELTAGTNAAETRCSEARQIMDTASTTLSEAIAAAAEGPQRPMLQQTQDRYTERARLLARRPELTATAETAAAQAQRTEHDLQAAGSACQTATAAHETSRTRFESACKTRDVLASQLQLLEGASAPAGIEGIGALADAARQQVTSAARELETSRTRHTAAVAALAAAAPELTLTSATDELEQLAKAMFAAKAASAALEEARTNTEAAAAALTVAEQALADADVTYAAAQATAGAAQLRPLLTPGDPCPVCQQTVTTLPPPLTDPALDAARHARDVAGAGHRDALAAHDAAARAVTAAERELEVHTARVRDTDERLTRLLRDRPAGDNRDLDADREHLAGLAAERRRLAADAADAAAALERVTGMHAVSIAEAQKAEAQVNRARATLHTALGQLALLTPPAVDDADLVAGWATLGAWAVEQATRLDAEVAAAEVEAAVAQSELATAADRLRAAEDAREAAGRTQTAAVRAATAADAKLRQVNDRLTELEEALADAAAEDDLPVLFAEADRLAETVTRARAAADAAQAEAKTAAEDLTRWRDRHTAAQTKLRAARDTVAAWTPPVLDDTDLVAAWAQLTEWAETQAAAQEGTVDTAQKHAATAGEEAATLTATLVTELDAHGLDPTVVATTPREVAARAPRAVEVAAERARGELAALQQAMKNAERLRKDIGKATEKQKVAEMLAGLLRSNKFPQWLADAALDTLVAGASETLRHLSNNQFDLTHKKGEFFVIDHADADMTRSVKTLSGGETFQASLALALALSDHLAGMGGTATLESIFLDEGFGTLDPDALETVANTLENLAQGDRMVGVITHVPALAERVPVRFHVRSETSTSTVVRDGVA